MKFRRSMSALLFGIGCALVFVGLIALILPVLDNPQLKLVLDSFFAPSENAVVQAMNQAMRFTLTDSWRVLLLGVITAALGAWLMNFFTPKRKKRPLPPHRTETAPVPNEPMHSGSKKENPFAVETGMNLQPVRRSPQSAVVWPLKPILEINRVEEIETPEITSVEYEAYHSPRLGRESRAIETEAESTSQSGSRMLVRSAYEPPLEEGLSVPDVRHEPEPAPASPVLSAPSAIQAPSPRIRSTMGRHRASGQR